MSGGVFCKAKIVEVNPSRGMGGAVKGRVRGDEGRATDLGSGARLGADLVRGELNHEGVAAGGCGTSRESEEFDSLRRTLGAACETALAGTERRTGDEKSEERQTHPRPPRGWMSCRRPSSSSGARPAAQGSGCTLRASRFEDEPSLRAAGGSLHRSLAVGECDIAGRGAGGER